MKGWANEARRAINMLEDALSNDTGRELSVDEHAALTAKLDHATRVAQLAANGAREDWRRAEGGC